LTALDKARHKDGNDDPCRQANGNGQQEQLLENIVFLELKRRYEHVYAGKIGTSEIDFVCRGENSGCYVQVAATGPVAPRLRPFRALRDRYPCLVITLDQSEMPENTGGVSVIPAVDWLLGERG
jgi:predicted AAA+ superfamily ATPase